MTEIILFMMQSQLLKAGIEAKRPDIIEFLLTEKATVDTPILTAVIMELENK